MIDDYIKLQAEIVNGKCPTCHELTILVGLTPELFRCISCGADLQQHVNGKISYLPSITEKTPLRNLSKLFGHGET
jgi:ribosomal protein S27E|tara:strand:+ start:51 stop:278 length:228 start_codon:yes stop_codon:yes gene_type:complete